MKYLIALAWILLTSILGYLPKQGDFFLILGCYAPLFGLYILTYRLYKSHQDVLLFVFLSIFLRVILMFAFPNLSDDIYRFLWDGYLINEGINPFLFTPDEWMSQSGIAEHYRVIYPHLNSPGYYSVYPPIAQGVFTICVKVFPTSLYWASVSMKLFFVLSEIFTIYFIMKTLQLLRLPTHRVLLYALNPLIIIELVGNLHFEALMILFFVLALWSFMRRRYGLFGFFFALSVAAKLLPLMFLPFFLLRMRFRQSVVACTVLIFSLGLFFLPFLSSELILNFSKSLNLYFQKFEFNASIYYLMRWLGYQRYGYNLIGTFGPLLSIFTFLIILGLAWFEKSRRLRRLFKSCLFAFTVYLLLGTTIHPWYLALPVFCSVFTYYRYAIFWSGLITLTYINYAYASYHENLWVVFLEYSIVLTILVIEIFRIPIAGLFLRISQYVPGLSLFEKGRP